MPFDYMLFAEPIDPRDRTMIDQLRHMAIFAKVLEMGSFRAAAKELGLAPSRISESVSALEQHLGVTLLYRTTRKITLTNEGIIFHARVLDMLHSAEAGFDELSALSEAPSGTLRISLPAFMGTGPLSTAIATFAQQYPKVNLSVTYTDRVMGLIEDGLDLNIRVGWLDDSSLMARKLAEGQRVLVAGKEYASRRETPQKPSDLESWDWIHYRQRSETTEFTSPTGEVEKVKVKAQLEIDNIDALNHIVHQNVGVTILPSYLAFAGVDSGKLVQLLPDWKLRPLGIYAVWPDNSRRGSLTLRFVRFLSEQELC